MSNRSSQEQINKQNALKCFSQKEIKINFSLVDYENLLMQICEPKPLKS